MKKAFISVAFAAALFFGASAQTTTATVPNWFSYQGVCSEKNATNVDVVFYINDAAGDPVYCEKHVVTTNAAGAFACQLGLGTPEHKDMWTVESFDEINWEAGAYSVQTWINGTEVGTAQLGSVPYALVAGKALGIAGVENIADELEGINTRLDNAEMMDLQMYQNLLTAQEDIETNANGLAEAEQAISEISEELPGIKGMINALEVEVNTNSDGLAEAEQSLIELTEQVKSNTAAIALLGGSPEVDLTAINEAIDDLQDWKVEVAPLIPGMQGAINKLREDVDLNIDGIEDLASWKTEVAPLIPGMQGAINKLREDVDTNIEAIDDLASWKIEVAPLIPGMQGAINKLNEEMEGIYEAFETQAMAAITSLSARVEDMDADLEALKAEVKTNSDGLAEVEQSVLEISEALPGMQAAINAVDAKYEGAWDEILKIKALIQTQGEAIADLQQQILHK